MNSFFETFLNDPEFIYLHTVKQLQVLLFNTNNSIFFFHLQS